MPLLSRLCGCRQTSCEANAKDTRRDVAIGAEHAHVLVFDNVSAIPADMSDAHCVLCTGGGFETRALYSDRGRAALSSSRCGRRDRR